MIFNNKVMFLGLENRITKENNSFTILKLLDKDTKENVNVFVQHPEKFRDIKPFTDVELSFNLIRGYDKDTKQPIWKLYLNEV